jgi:hypothetical protein
MAQQIYFKYIRIFGPNEATYESEADWHEANDDALSNIDWDDVEDDINDLLPEGFYCKIEN